MQNRIKEELRLKLQGQLSDEKTQLDIDNAYGVVEDTVFSFLMFLRENCCNYDFAYDEWGVIGERGKFYIDEEIFKKFVESYGDL